MRFRVLAHVDYGRPLLCVQQHNPVSYMETNAIVIDTELVYVHADEETIDRLLKKRRTGKPGDLSIEESITVKPTDHGRH
jgi:hypothetical protein